jgi:HrpA-like RNA helicase
LQDIRQVLTHYYFLACFLLSLFLFCKKIKRNPLENEGSTLLRSKETTQAIKSNTAKSLFNDYKRVIMDPKYFDDLIEHRKVNFLNGKPFSTSYLNLLRDRKTLPVWEFRLSLLQTIYKHAVVVINGNTGCGKTTQIPQFLAIQQYGNIVCTQPRRAAAVTIAKRVALEMDVNLGEAVGYRIKDDSKISQSTVLTFVTEGMLVRDALSNQLDKYSVIIIDEAHERSIHTDLLCCVLKNALFTRANIKVIIMSASMQVDRFSKFFFNCPVINIPGKLHSVTINYLPTRIADLRYSYIALTIRTITQLLAEQVSTHSRAENRNILVFLPGKDDITTLALELSMALSDEQKQETVILPFHSQLSMQQQEKIFGLDPHSRAIILSTNIAESSVTIPNIGIVIDSGLIKRKVRHSFILPYFHTFILSYFHTFILSYFHTFIL